MSNFPKISIVTPSLNQGRYLAQAIESVISQQYPNYEHIIIDGGSSDETLEVIQKYEQQLHAWVSEPDLGQSDAINKGMKIANGEIVTWLNADDFFAPGAFFEVAKAFDARPNTAVISGYYESFGEKGESYKHLRMKKLAGLEETIFFGMISTPAMFYRTSIFKQLGYFNTSLHYFFDLEFYYRFLLGMGLSSFSLIESNLTLFRLHENSKTVSLKDKFKTEAYHLHRTMLASMKPIPILCKALELPHRYLEVPLVWNASELNPIKMAAYFAERTLERMHRDFSFITFMQIYFWSFLRLPFGRRWRFYLLPIRKLGWLVKGI